MLFALVAVACVAGHSRTRMDPGTAQPAMAAGGDERLQVRVAPYSSAMEKDTFGFDLHEHQQLAIEIELRRRPTQDPASLRVRRYDIELTFADGGRRRPIDPLKVYEKARVNTAVPTAGFGVLGALTAIGMDKKRDATLSTMGLTEVQLSPQASTHAGFLFFDLEGIHPDELRSLIITYEVGDAGETHTLSIDLSGR